MRVTQEVEDTVRGPDGRQISFLARGPEDGTPVIYMHGAPGSRREQHLYPENLYDRFGVRAISIDRPGYGATDPLPGDRVSRVQDVLTVCDALGIGRFAVLAISSGGSYALTIAAIAPLRVARVVLSSAQMPYDNEDAIADLQPNQAAGLPMLRAGRSRELVQMYEQVRSALLTDTIGAFEKAMASLSAREQDWYAQVWVREALASDVQEGMRASVEGYLEDGLNSVRPFEIDVSDVGCPVRAVHGTADDWEPLANLRRVLADVPDSQLFLLEGLNHLGPLIYPDLLFSLCVGDR